MFLITSQFVYTLTETPLVCIQVSYLKEFGIGTEEVGKLLAFKPQLMGCSIEEKLKPLVKYLYYHGISRDGMKRILMSKPIVFCMDLETTIVPKVCPCCLYCDVLGVCCKCSIFMEVLQAS